MDLNSTTFTGRLTRDPEFRSFANGGGVTKLGLAVSGRKKTGGEWQDDPLFIDVEVYNRGEGKMANLLADSLVKGSRVAVKGELKLDTWDDKTTGQKRSKHKIVADSVVFLDPKEDRTANKRQAQEGGHPVAEAGEGEDIPF